MKKQIKIPKHIAFIMDGNGRWATKRRLERNLGHKKGAEALKVVLERCFDIGVEVVSVYAFSTENFKRPKKEVDGIFKYANDFLLEYEAEIETKNIKLVVMGDLSMVPEPFKSNLERVIEKTKNNTKGVFNMGIAYGGRCELVYAFNKLLKSGKTQVDEQDISNCLYTANLPDPDLIVRASGENRLSNFMLYQCAYSEFYFPKTLWPDFNAKMVDKCVKVYSKRNRRFGKV